MAISAPLARRLRFVVLSLVGLFLVDAVLNWVFCYSPPDENQRWALPRGDSDLTKVLPELVSVAAQSDPVTAVDSRLTRHESAAEFLSRLTFYRNGEGMFATPLVSDFYFQWMIERGWKGAAIRKWAQTGIGLYSGTNESMGFLDRSHNGVRLVVTGCATCHFGRAAGFDIAGLGNKNVDPWALGRWIEQCDKILDSVRLTAVTAEARDSRSRSLEMAACLQQDRLANQTEGMVAVAHIFDWFYRQAGRATPGELPRGAVKVPSLWGYYEKVSCGLFCDGMGDGSHSAWAAMTELAAGNSVENIRGQLEQILAAESRLTNLLPPAYPFSIDRRKSQMGAIVFAKNCRRCHGEYQLAADGFPEFKSPRHILIDEVDTDSDRLELITPEVIQLVPLSPLADVIRLNPKYRRGYFAPRLEGIWARFPYLHNGSVPNVAALLKPAKCRPQWFDLTNAGEANRFDSIQLGLDAPEINSLEALRLARLSLIGSRQVYDCSRRGHSNRGHEFGTDLTENEKQSLIEYLKTL